MECVCVCLFNTFQHIVSLSTNCHSYLYTVLFEIWPWSFSNENQTSNKWTCRSSSVSRNDKLNASYGPDRVVAALLVRSLPFPFPFHYSSSTNTAGIASKAVCPCEPFSCLLILQQPARSSFLFVFLFPLFLPSIVSFCFTLCYLMSCRLSWWLSCLRSFFGWLFWSFRWVSYSKKDFGNGRLSVIFVVFSS